MFDLIFFSLMQFFILLFALPNTIMGRSSTCSDIHSEWIPIEEKIHIPGTALAGGRQYTMEEEEWEFSNKIFHPDGGVCLAKHVPVESECDSNASKCLDMQSCIHRNGGKWMYWEETNSVLSGCFSECSDPVLFCHKVRCDATSGCKWFVKTQSNNNECFCQDENKQIHVEKKIWKFWHQPLAVPVFLLAIVSAGWIVYNIWLFNLRALFRRHD